MLKVPGKKLSDREAVMAHYLSGNEVLDQEIECIADVLIKNAYIEYFTEQDSTPHMPYLMIYGQVQSMRGDFPFDVGELTFDAGGETVHCLYRFTDNQVIDLIRKGLYHPGFKVPDILLNNQIEVPITCRIRAVAPSRKNMDNPDNRPVVIVFSEISNPHSILLTKDNSGYDLSDNFEPLPDLDWQLPPATTVMEEAFAEETPEAEEVAEIKQQPLVQPIVLPEEETQAVDFDSDFDEIMHNVYKNHPDALGSEHRDTAMPIGKYAKTKISKDISALQPDGSVRYDEEEVETETPVSTSSESEIDSELSNAIEDIPFKTASISSQSDELVTFDEKDPDEDQETELASNSYLSAF